MLTDAELELLRGRTDNSKTLQALAELDRKREWQAKLDSIIPDTRVWPIIAAIEDSGMAYLEVGGFTTEDIMGYKPRYFEPTARDQRKGRFIGRHEECFRIGALERCSGGLVRTQRAHSGGVVISPEGWDRAKPLLQLALDCLRVPFEAGPHSGLICSLGVHRWERVWNLSGVDLPEFDSLLGDFPYVPFRNLTDLPMTWRLVKVDGWETDRAGCPMRPDDHPDHVSWDDLRTAIHRAAPEVVERWYKRR